MQNLGASPKRVMLARRLAQAAHPSWLLPVGPGGTGGGVTSWATPDLMVGAFVPVWKEDDCGEDLQPGHKATPLFAAGEGKKAAYQNGATLLGDERSGRSSHDMAKGEYRMAERTVVTITNKHWLLPWPLVEARLRELVR